MKVKIKGFINCKSAEQFIDCADNYAINEISHRFSVSDGVSKSFFPKIWSEILVTHFVERTDLKESELIKACQEEWQKRIDDIISLPDTKWHTRTLYNRKEPALATFVRLQFFEKEKKWFASALGDSFLFFVPKGIKDFKKELIKLSSKSEPIVFDNFPDYCSSIGESHKGRAEVKGGNLKDGTFYLMTDALAEWFLNEGRNAVGKITVWQTQSDFERFISLAIDEKQLTNDDCAILCIELSEADRKGIEYKKIQVTDLNDLINNQDSENEKVKQKIQQVEKQLEIQKGKKLETSQDGSLSPESLVQEIEEESPKEGLISKFKGFFSGKEKEEIKETLPDKKVDSEIELSLEQNSEDLEITDEEQKNPKTIVIEKSNPENDKKDELEKVKVEEQDKNDSEKTNAEKLELKEQPKVDSQVKNIFDKF